MVGPLLRLGLFMRTLIRRDEQDEQVESELYLDGVTCERCCGTAFVVMGKAGLRWSLACVYCNARTDGPPLGEQQDNSRLETAPEALSGLRFREGRYSDQTLKEIAASVEGAEYLNWYAKSGKSAFMRERVAEFLALLGQ